MHIPVYCLSYKNPVRRENMQRRFNKVGLHVDFYNGVDDERLHNLDDKYRRVWSCMFGHLDMIYDFCQSEREYGVFCEDDILVKRDIAAKLPYVARDMITYNLDVVLLGYLISFSFYKTNHSDFRLVAGETDTSLGDEYYEYPFNLWGTQMYMLSKKYAKQLLNKYYGDYCHRSLLDSTMIHFSADWTITKDGRRAALARPLAIEDNSCSYEDPGQADLHRNSHTVFYTSEFI
jgi:GR25 family glycosyltransferase involved in LPS biosynthesis